MDRITNDPSGSPHSHPVNSKKDMTVHEWQLRMGIRCPECEKYLEDCKCQKVMILGGPSHQEL